jgi:hypothetical protein
MYAELDEIGKKQYIKDKIFQFLPTFLDYRSENLNSLINVIVNAIYRVNEETLIQHFWVGKGLRLTAEGDRIFYKQAYSDNDIQSLLIDRFNILVKRGTEAGIQDDISNMDLNISPTVEFLDTGWIMDQVYPETEGSKISFLDGYKSIKLNMNYPYSIGHGRIGHMKIGDHFTAYIGSDRQKIDNKIVPADTQIIYE